MEICFIIVQYGEIGFNFDLERIHSNTNCVDQKLMQSVQNVETSKEPQYVVSTKSCRIQKEGAERRGLLCFWINNDKRMLKKDRPSKKLPSHPPYLSHCLTLHTRKLQDKCGGTHLR